ncbi:SRPBCC family protein [Gilvibacter sp.]|uniref:SRPBCC family protein n=1 Tax=Gilvibacter sp. TaxID=2729997 RepID=UPI003F4A1CE8
MKIKNLLFAALMLLLSGYTASAQNMGEPKVQFSKVINKSADEMWKTVRKLDQVHKYSSVIAKVDWNGNMGVGGERVCQTADGQGFFKERIVAYDESSRSFSYALLEGAPVKGMTNFMQVVDLGYNKCILVWWSNYDEFMKNPQMTEGQFQAFMLSSIEEMTDKMAKDS